MRHTIAIVLSAILVATPIKVVLAQAPTDSTRIQTPTRIGVPVVESGSGAALFDYDEDGDLDIYFVNGSRIEAGAIVPAQPNRLYRNEGGWRFVDVTEAAGVGG